MAAAGSLFVLALVFVAAAVLLGSVLWFWWRSRKSS
jgi:hypothetical protein